MFRIAAKSQIQRKSVSHGLDPVDIAADSPRKIFCRHGQTADEMARAIAVFRPRKKRTTGPRRWPENYFPPVTTRAAEGNSAAEIGLVVMLVSSIHKAIDRCMFRDRLRGYGRRSDQPPVRTPPRRVGRPITS